jgi:hypothetical protein
MYRTGDHHVKQTKLKRPNIPSSWSFAEPRPKMMMMMITMIMEHKCILGTVCGESAGGVGEKKRY